MVSSESSMTCLSAYSNCLTTRRVGIVTLVRRYMTTNPVVGVLRWIVEHDDCPTRVWNVIFIFVAILLVWPTVVCSTRELYLRCQLPRTSDGDDREYWHVRRSCRDPGDGNIAG